MSYQGRAVADAYRMGHGAFSKGPVFGPALLRFCLGQSFGRCFASAMQTHPLAPPLWPCAQGRLEGM